VGFAPTNQLYLLLVSDPQVAYIEVLMRDVLLVYLIEDDKYAVKQHGQLAFRPPSVHSSVLIDDFFQIDQDWLSLEQYLSVGLA
jgi:hypothetical protein